MNHRIVALAGVLLASRVLGADASLSRPAADLIIAHSNT